MVKGGKPAAERAALISASTAPAGVAPGVAEVLGAALAGVDAVDAEAEWLGEAEADGVGWARRRLGWTGGAPGGTVAALMPMGLGSAQAPARAEPHASVVCNEVTVPRADGATAETGPRVK
jgi:hypothetical protein